MKPYRLTTHTRQNLGRYAFDTIKSGGSEVYYGEWVGKEYAKGTNRGVYYSGDKRATSMPVSGVANYAVKGINNYTGNNPLTGTLRADFGQKVLTGSMKTTPCSWIFIPASNRLAHHLKATPAPTATSVQPKATSSATVQARWPVLPN